MGKRTAARAFAAELLAEGSPDPDNARHRALSGSHPDLTWVRPTGAHVMRTEDVDEPVVAAATRTPFESRRRVFVLERVDTMNDEVANRLLKTLEEPAAYVHLILLTDALSQVIPTVVSRCQLVRFDPLPAERIAASLAGEGVPADVAEASARLALGSAERARYLASEEGQALRRGRGPDAGRRPLGRLARPSTSPSRGEGCWPGPRSVARPPRRGWCKARSERLESEPKGRERGALERRFDETAKRDGRRARTELLELGLTLVALGFRDLVCVAEGAEEVALDPDRAATLGARRPRPRSAAAARGRRALRGGAHVAGGERVGGPGAGGAGLSAQHPGGLGLAIRSTTAAAPRSDHPPRTHAPHGAQGMTL